MLLQLQNEDVKLFSQMENKPISFQGKREGLEREEALRDEPKTAA